MKKRILLIFCAVLVFGLAAAAFAYNQAVSDDKPAACCCKGDSCPMMKTDAAGGEAKADGEKHSCCGNSCPMMKKNAEGHDSAQHSGDHAKMADMDHAKADAKAHNCCGDSCPMKKEHKEGEMADHQKMAGSMEHGQKDGESHACCACCKEHKAEKAAA